MIADILYMITVYSYSAAIESFTKISLDAMCKTLCLPACPDKSLLSPPPPLLSFLHFLVRYSKKKRKENKELITR